MASTSALRTAEIHSLRRSSLRYGHDRTALLTIAGNRPIRSTKALREWHDLLLFVLAHPQDAAEHAWGLHQLERATALAKRMIAQSESHLEALANSGLEGSALYGPYTFTLVRWMLHRWPGQVQLYLLDAPLDELREILRTLVLPVEQETLDQPFDDVDELLAAVLGTTPSQQLTNLIALLEQRQVDDRHRELLFARMQVHVRIAEDTPGLSLSHARGPVGRHFFHTDGIQRGVNLMATVSTRLGKQIKLTAQGEEELINTARTVLAAMHREIDPTTYAGAAELFDMGRGLRIALFHLDAAHRLPFDSYVGFMAFKNGVPLAYGGAWIFPGRSKVGINVFPSQRGGESALFFAQLLRLYRQRFGVDRFEAENYQLGHNNPDGLRSGAYWFYYRLGFRPSRAAHQRKAASEFAKLNARKDYPVPLATLRELVEAGLELVVNERAGPLVDTAALTVAVQQHILQVYRGDRAKALTQATSRLDRVLAFKKPRRWTQEEHVSMACWALPLDMIPDLEQWSVRDRQNLIEAIRSKSAPTGTQHQYVLKKHLRLRHSWQAVARAQE